MMEKRNIVKVAVIGTGFGQKVQIPGFQQSDRAEVVAVYHRDAIKAEAIAASHNIPHHFHHLSDLLASPSVDAVSICTPPFLHYEMGLEVLKAGKHLLLEKPTALNVGEARELQQLALEKGVVAAMDFEFRFVPAWMRFAELLQEEYVGKKRLIKIDWLVSSRSDPTRPWNWYSQKQLGGGALGAVGSHVFDYIKWLFGDIKSLSARLSTAITERPLPETGEMRPVDADDTCLISLELTDGTPCQVCISSVTDRGRGHFVEVYGERGTLILGSDNQKDYVHGFRLWGAPVGKSMSEIEIPQRLRFPREFADGRIAPFIRVVERWIEGIDRGESLTPSLQEGVYSQLLMDLAHQSHQQRQWIDVTFPVS